MRTFREVEVDPVVLNLVTKRGSRQLRWYEAAAGSLFLRVFRSRAPLGPQHLVGHISASVGGKFGTVSIRKPADAEMADVLETVGAGRSWEEDNAGDDPNVRHFWEIL